MKKYNIYSNGILILTETEEELMTTDRKKIKKHVEKLEVGDRYVYTEKSNLRDWEIERVV